MIPNEGTSTRTRSLRLPSDATPAAFAAVDVPGPFLTRTEEGAKTHQNRPLSVLDFLRMIDLDPGRGEVWKSSSVTVSEAHRQLRPRAHR